MFNFFKKRNLVTDISWLGVDIHSHILPGIDDGSKNLEQSLSYIKTMNNLGFEKLIFTPHIFREMYPNSVETIMPALQNVTQHCKVDVKLSAAAEYMLDNDFEIAEGLLCLIDNYLLVEMSYLSETPNIEQLIFDLQVKGYKVVLAHPERYNFYHKNLSRYQRLKEMGCLFQLNILSVVGYYGKAVKQAADYLISKNMFDLAATDLHHDNHINLLEKVITNGQLYTLIGNYDFNNKQLFG